MTHLTKKILLSIYDEIQQLVGLSGTGLQRESLAYLKNMKTLVTEPTKRAARHCANNIVQLKLLERIYYKNNFHKNPDYVAIVKAINNPYYLSEAFGEIRAYEEEEEEEKAAVVHDYQSIIRDKDEIIYILNKRITELNQTIRDKDFYSIIIGPNNGNNILF